MAELIRSSKSLSVLSPGASKKSEPSRPIRQSSKSLSVSSPLMNQMAKVNTPELDAAVGNSTDFVAPSSQTRQLTNEEQALEIMGLLNPVDFSPEAVAQREWENAGVKNAEEYRKALPGIVQKDVNDLKYFFEEGALLAAESGLANTVSSLAEAGRAINDFVTKPTPFTEALSAGYAPYVDKSKDVSKKGSDYLLGFADEQAQSSQGAMDIAKSNVNGTVGEVLLDATAAGSQMVGDIVISGATGGSTKIPMALRSFGAGVQDARNKGYTAEQQIAMGLSSAAIEYITEKFFGGNPFYDKAEAGMINEAIKWLGGNEQLLSFLSSTPVETLNEGLEEILSGVLNPAMEYIIAGQADPIVLEDLLKDGLIGVMLGGAGQVANRAFQPNASAQQEQTATEEASEVESAPPVEEEVAPAEPGQQNTYTPGSRNHANAIMNDPQVLEQFANEAELDLNALRNMPKAELRKLILNHYRVNQQTAESQEAETTPPEQQEGNTPITDALLGEQTVEEDVDQEDVLSQIQAGDKLVDENGNVVAEIKNVTPYGITYIDSDGYDDMIPLNNPDGESIFETLGASNGHFERPDGTWVGRTANTVPADGMETQAATFGRSVGAATPAHGPQVPTQSKPVTESNWMSEEEKARVAPETHERIGRALREARAEAMFAMDSSGNIVNAAEVVTDLLDMPFGSWNAVAQEGAMIAAQTPAVRSNEEMFQAVFDRYVRERTEQARALQAGQDWMAHTPMGKVAEAIRAVNAINKDGKNKVELSDKEVKQIYALMEKAQQLRESDLRAAAKLEAEADKIIAAKIPVSIKNKVIRFLMDNMLGNFRTLITRNAGGNLIFAVPEAISKLPTAAVDAATSLVTKERYYAMPDAEQVKAYGKGFAKGAKETIEDFKWDVHTPRSGETLDYSAQIKPFSSWACNAVDKLVQTGLEVGDRPVYEANYQARMAELNKLLDSGKLPEKMMQNFSELAPLEARLTALEAVFQSEGKMAKGLTEIKSAVQNIIDAATGIGLGGQFSVPFTRTPGNILQRTLEYMPGISTVKNTLTTGKEIAEGKFDQRRFSRETGRNITGMGIAALASQAVATGLITGGGDDRPDEELLDQSGWQEYSIKIGDKYFSYEWIPILGPLMAGTADFIGALDDDAENPLLHAIGAGLQSTAEMSALSGMSRMFGGYSGIVGGLGDMLLGGTSQIVPSLVRQAARATDDYERSTYDPNKLKQQWNYIKSGIPGLRQTLPVQYDLFGNPIEVSDGRGSGAKWFENLLSPSYVSEEQHDPRTDEMLRLRDAGYNVPVPEIPKSRDIDGNGVNDKLTADELSAFTQSRNSTFGELASAFIGSASYEAMSDQSKSLLLSEAMEFASAMATAELYKGRGEEYTLDKWMVDAAESSDPARYIQAYRTFTIASNEERRDYKALDGLMELYRQLPESDRAALNDSSSELRRLYEAHQKGVSSKAWYKTSDAISAQEKANGDENLNNYEKLETVIKTASGKDVDVLLPQYLSGNMPTKYEMAREQGYSPERFVEAYTAMNTIESDRDENGESLGNVRKKVIAHLVSLGWPEANAAEMYKFLSGSTGKKELANWKW